MNTCPFTAMADQISDICAKTFQKIQPDGSCCLRTFHTPLVANLEGEPETYASLTDQYRRGLFAEPGNYPVTA